MALIGRDDLLMEKLATLVSKEANRHHEISELHKTERGYSFDVQVLVDDEPSGHLARVGIELLTYEGQ